MKRFFYLLSSLVAGSLLISGCVGGQAQLALPENSTGHWQFQSGRLNGKAFNADGENITLNYEDKHLFGSSGVNRYQAPVTISGNRLTFTDGIATTRMAGSIEAMRLESDYLSALRAANTIERKDRNLIMRGENVELKFIAP